MNVLWRGSWATRLRIASGLVLFTYVLFHFLNIGLGLFSPEWLEWGQDWRQVITRNVLGELLIYAALLTHAGLAMYKLALRRTLRMPIWEAIQISFGLLIPLLLIAHFVHTRLAHQIYAVNDEMSYIMVLIWGTQSGWNQALLLLLVWGHGCIGLHFWLRLKPWWRSALPYMIAIAALIPAFALAGFLTEGRRIRAEFTDDQTRADLMRDFNWPSFDAFVHLNFITDVLLAVFWGLLALTALVYLGRKMIARRKSVMVRYVDGPEVISPKGMTLLEMSRVNGVPHTALCGGRGRCTTCRVVVEEGADLLHPPSETEARSLRSVNAPPGARLACQIRPTHASTVFRVFRPDGKRGRAHSSQGQERRLAILFLDMRGFTARTTGQLPYDVVFLLNRFFDAIVPAIISAGGTVDKYLGDGLLAVFETADSKTSARAALNAAIGIGAALDKFNKTLTTEGLPEVAIGVGIHLGDVVLGEIGAAGNAPRTLIGDTVNTTSRLEGMTKELGVQLLVSQALLQSAGVATDDFDMIALDLRGLAEPLSALSVLRGGDLTELLRGHGFGSGTG